MDSSSSGRMKGLSPHRREKRTKLEREEVAPNHPAIMMTSSPEKELFSQFKGALDARTDQRERIIKCSREITIQSKRIIFLLHRITSLRNRNHQGDHNDNDNHDHDHDHNDNDDVDDPETRNIIAQAHAAAAQIRIILSSINQDLQGFNYYRYHRHFSPGLQEFIEALSFLEYMEHRVLLTQDRLKEYFEYEGKQLFVPTDEDYILGIADLTGELMRYAINGVASGNQTIPFTVLPFLRQLGDVLQSFDSFGIRELRQKLSTLESSLQKVEKVCYEITIRGSEYPRELLAQFLASEAPSNERE